MRTFRFRRPRPGTTALLAAATFAACARQATATNRTYVGPNNGFWNTASNWTGGVVPSAAANPADAALVQSAVSKNVFFDANYPGAALFYVEIDATTAGAAMTLTQSANTLTTTSLAVGQLGTGVYSLSSTGVLNVTNDETIGYNPNISGTFIQSGGLHSFAGNGYLVLGNATSSSGSYGLSGGTLSVAANSAGELVGQFGNATFTQSGGTHSINSPVFAIADTAGTTATYSLSAGSLNDLGASEWVGYGGRATFNHTAGTHTVGTSAANSSTLYVGDLSGSLGTYSLSGTGSLTVFGNEIVGNTGSGTFTQTGGTHTVSGNLIFGDVAGGVGSYSLSGGSLTIGTAAFNEEFVGISGTATFNQTGGTHAVNSAYFTTGWGAGGTGTYNLSGGSLAVTAFEWVGWQGTGSFNQTGGSHVIGTPAANRNLYIADQAGSAGTYLLAGATAGLTVNGNIEIGRTAASGTLPAPVGSFIHSAGTAVVTGSVAIGEAPGTGGSYTLSGSGSLSTFNEYLATANDSSATFLQTGGTHAITGNVWQVAGPAGSSATYTLAGGTLNFGSGSGTSTEEYVGIDGNAAFNQSGGTHTVNAAFLTIGWGAAGTGTYNLSGGTLNANAFEWVGWNGTGTFNQTGGTHTVGTPGANQFLHIADQPGSRGTYRLTGPLASLTVNGNESIGVNGPTATLAGASGSFVQTTGTHVVTGTLALANNPGATGSFTLSGGSLTVGYLNTNGDPSRFQWTGGTLSITTMPLALAPSGPLGQLLTLAPSQTLLVAQPMTNNGALTLAGGTVGGVGPLLNNSFVTGYGTLYLPLTNSAGGNVQLSPSGTALSLNAPLTNSGNIDLGGANLSSTASVTNNSDGLISGRGTLSASTFSNAGAIVLDSGSLKIAPAFTNTGQIQLNGLTANLSGGAITNTGAIQGRGKLSSAVSNTTGTIEPVGGTLTLGGPLTNAPAAALRVAAGNTLLVTGPVPTNNGAINLTGGTLDTNNQPLANAGTLTASAGASSVAVPLTNVSGGKTIVTGNATATFLGPVTNLAGSEFRVTAGSTASFLAPVTGAGLFTGTGSKFFEAGASSPGLLATGGDTTVESPASLTTSYLNESSLTAYGPVSLLPDSSASTLSALDLTTTGSLDLSNDTLNLTGTSVSTLRSDLASGQLFSSLADSTHALGYVPGLVVKLTLKGDANLDGVINADDYALLDAGYATGASTWWKGDFNYDGAVTPADYLILDSTYLSTHAPSPGFLAQRESQFGPGYVSALLASVPEPSLLSSILYPLSSLLLTRRRRT